MRRDNAVGIVRVVFGKRYAREMLDLYVGYGYAHRNSSLRNDTVEPRQMKKALKMRQLMQPQHQSMTVYRGINDTLVTDQLLQAAETQQPFVEPAYMSTSRLPEIARRFSGRALLLVITVDSPVRALSVADWRGADHEAEVIFEPGCQLIVDRIFERDSPSEPVAYTVYAHVLPPQAQSAVKQTWFKKMAVAQTVAG